MAFQEMARINLVIHVARAALTDVLPTHSRGMRGGVQEAPATTKNILPLQQRNSHVRRETGNDRPCKGTMRKEVQAEEVGDGNHSLHVYRHHSLWWQHDKPLVATSTATKWARPPSLASLMPGVS